MVPTVELFHAGGAYQERVRQHLGRLCGAEVAHHQLPTALPMIIDEPEEFLPSGMGEADIAIAIGLHHDLLVELPHALARGHTKALLVPLEDPGWAKQGLRNQVTRACDRLGIEIAFAKPFCDLQPLSSAIEEFCQAYQAGRPQYDVEWENGAARTVRCVRGSPCGLSHGIAAKLVGVGEEEFVRRAVEELHTFPCLSSMAPDPELGDTIMHEAIRLMERGAQAALPRTSRGGGAA